MSNANADISAAAGSVLTYSRSYVQEPLRLILGQFQSVVYGNYRPTKTAPV